MKAIAKIRSEIELLHQSLCKNLETIQRLQEESLAHLGDDPEAVAQEDDRLKLPFVFAGYLGIVFHMTRERKRRLRGLLDNHVTTLESVGGSLRTHATNMKNEAADPLESSLKEAIRAAERDLRRSTHALSDLVKRLERDLERARKI